MLFDRSWWRRWQQKEIHEDQQQIFMAGNLKNSYFIKKEKN